MKGPRGRMMAAERKARQHKFLSMIIEAHTLGKFIDKEKLIAMASWRWGLARRTSVDYINTLLHAGLVYENENNLILATDLGKQECIVPIDYELTKNEEDILDG